MTKTSFFAATIKHLRTKEAILIYDHILEVKPAEETDLANWLASEYKTEKLNHPFVAPEFDAAAAIWAAKTVFYTAQFILHRNMSPEDFEPVFEDFKNSKTPAAILSVDLCLRFLPTMLTELRAIDSNDPLIPFLETKLKQWPYSTVGYQIENPTADYSSLLSDDCLRQLLIDRIITRKDIDKAKAPGLTSYVKASLGDYVDVFWNALG